MEQTNRFCAHRVNVVYIRASARCRAGKEGVSGAIDRIESCDRTLHTQSQSSVPEKDSQLNLPFQNQARGYARRCYGSKGGRSRR